MQFTQCADTLIALPIDALIRLNGAPPVTLLVIATVALLDVHD